MQSKLRAHSDNKTIHALGRILNRNQQSHRLQAHALGHSPPGSCNFRFQIKNFHFDADVTMITFVIYIFTFLTQYKYNDV